VDGGLVTSCSLVGVAHIFSYPEDGGDQFPRNLVNKFKTTWHHNPDDNIP
jgi:hypothetical protein